MKSIYSHRPLIRVLLFLILSLFLTSLASSAVAAPPAGPNMLADFEGGVPGGWFVYSGGGSTVTPITEVVGETDPLARPGQVGDNTLLTTAFSIGDFGGFGHDLAGSGGPQDWAVYGGLSFWFYGSNSGLTYQVDIMDNRSDPNSDTAERFAYWFHDDFTGWRKIIAPWGAFVRRPDWQPGGAPDDGLTLTEMWGWAFVLPFGSSTFSLDEVGLVTIIDDFESGLPSGSDGYGNAIGFYLFHDGGGSTTIAISTTDTLPAPVPGASDPNNVLQVDTNVVNGGWAGLVHAFENEALDTWVTQDWSAYEGISFWIYGQNSGTIVFIDLLDNRWPESTTDDAERWTLAFEDDFIGWRYFEFPFTDFVIKDIGNGAPNDGLTLTEMHGWGFGTLGTDDPITYYIDDVGLYGGAEVIVTAEQEEVIVDEGSTAFNTVTAEDIDGDPLTLSASAGTLTNNNDGTWSWSFVANDGPDDSQTVTIIADDGEGGIGQTTFELLVYNVAPTINSVTNDGPIVAGSDATIVVNASDPAGANDLLSYEFDCDNDDYYEIGPQPGASASCGFDETGDRLVNVRVADDDGGVSEQSTTVIVLTPQDAVDELITEQVEDLEDTGVLNYGQGNALISILENATSMLDQGKTKTAIKMLNAFINEVNGLISGGILTPAEGQALIDAASDIINAINS